MANIISSHHIKIIKFGNETNGKACNCRNKINFPLDNKCLINKVVYKGEIETNDGINELSTKVYFGISKTEFKSRYNNHTISFRNWTRKNNTEPLKYICSLKDVNNDFILNGPFLKNLLNIVFYQNCVIFASWKN